MAKAKEKKRGGFFAIAFILVLLMLVGLQLANMRERISRAESEQTAIAAQLAQQRQENASLEAALSKANDPEYLQELARDQLNMVSPGQRDFYDVSN